MDGGGRSRFARFRIIKMVLDSGSENREPSERQPGRNDHTLQRNRGYLRSHRCRARRSDAPQSFDLKWTRLYRHESRWYK
jgi:hypothetical protein